MVIGMSNSESGDKNFLGHLDATAHVIMLSDELSNTAGDIIDHASEDDLRGALVILAESYVSLLMNNSTDMLKKTQMESASEIYRIIASAMVLGTQQGKTGLIDGMMDE